MIETIIDRPLYMENILSWVGQTGLVKVYTGERRSGKSQILRLILEHVIRESGRPDECIYWNSEQYINPPTLDELYEILKDKQYIFLDEIQEIPGWERVVRKLLTEGGHDVHVTGSNASLLSGELATFLSGRYHQFEIWPLSYSEFCTFHSLESTNDTLKKYVQYGGMPYLIHFDWNEEHIAGYLEDIIDSIVLRDIVTRYSIRNIDFFRRLLRYMADHIGDIFSALSISKYLKSQKMSLTPQVILNYLSYAQSAYILHKVLRYDIVGKRVFEVREKYFFTDIGLRNRLVGGLREQDMDGILENLVYIELRKASWDVFVGEIGKSEIDFVAEKNGKKMYIQCMLKYNDTATWEREMSPFRELRDGWSRYIVSLYEGDGGESEGVKWMCARDFCLQISGLL